MEESVLLHTDHFCLLQLWTVDWWKKGHSSSSVSDDDTVLNKLIPKTKEHGDKLSHTGDEKKQINLFLEERMRPDELIKLLPTKHMQNNHWVFSLSFCVAVDSNISLLKFGESTVN